MVRKRLITVLTYLDGVLFRTRNFLPDYRYTHNFVDTWSVDEIVLLDITPPGQGDRKNFEAVVDWFSRKCFVPICAGGGIRSLEDISRLLHLGADKVSVNTAAIQDPMFLESASRRFGCQCIVAGIDCQPSGDSYEVVSGGGKIPTGLNAEEWARTVEEKGAGEILLQSVEKDGTLLGYDTRLVSLVSNATGIPILCCSGAGNWQNFVDGFLKGGADAVCTTNIYHFTDSSIRSAKAFLERAGIEIRSVS